MHSIKILVLPPLSLLLLAVAGLLLLRRKPRLGRGLLIAAVALLWILSTPIVAGALLWSLQDDPALDAGALPPADAIVVLSADMEVSAPEFGTQTVGQMTMQRLRYAALLQRRTGLPLLVTGGQARSEAPPLADLMRATLQDELGVAAQWIERRSHNTLENASLSAPILKSHAVQRILLVTHAWHMPRARACFEAQGLEVIAAPTAFCSVPFEGLSSLLPNWQAMRNSHHALHEWAGLVAYHLFYL